MYELDNRSPKTDTISDWLGTKVGPRRVLGSSTPRWGCLLQGTGEVGDAGPSHAHFLCPRHQEYFVVDGSPRSLFSGLAMNVIPSTAACRSWTLSTRHSTFFSKFYSSQHTPQVYIPPSTRCSHLAARNLMGAPFPNDKPHVTGKRTAAGTVTMAPSKFQVSGYTQHSAPKPASPSASVILISPTNEVLLLHRVQTSSAFPSAHVFPGGNLEAADGPLPQTPTDVNRHLDSLAYRTGAIRELFEETGILLARESKGAKTLLKVPRTQRKEGREAVHKGKTGLAAWLRDISSAAVLDTDRLIPFTHWVTPPNVPKRFTTQMYVYFVGLEEAGNPSVQATGDEVETMAPEWKRARDWLTRARNGEIILFPPQFLLLFMISEILDRGIVEGQREAEGEILNKREELLRRIDAGGWRDKFISPIGLQYGREDGRSVLALDKPGPELKGSGLKGDSEYVVLVRFNKEGPREVEVGLRKEVLRNERQLEEQKQEGSKL